MRTLITLRWVRQITGASIFRSLYAAYNVILRANAMPLVVFCRRNLDDVSMSFCHNELRDTVARLLRAQEGRDKEEQLQEITQ